MVLNKTLEKKEYFTIDDYIEDKLVVQGGISIIVAGRDIGKTTGTFLNWLDKCSDKEMIFYIRNTVKEIDSYKASFNAEWGHKYNMTNTQIWKMKKVILINKKTREEEVHYRKDKVIGYVGSLSGTDGWRSANFSNIKYIFSDEFNQIGNSLDFQKFMTLWTSILRTKENVYTCIIGNRDDASSDMVVELGIDILVPSDHKGDWIQPLIPDNEKFKNKCYFIDVDESRFFNNKETVWKAIGRGTQSMGKYYERGYKSYDNVDCKSLSPSVLDLVDWKYSYTEDIRITVGQLNEITIVHHDQDKKIKTDVNYAVRSDVIRNRGLTDVMDRGIPMYRHLTNAMKNKTILYTSIHVKETINWIIDRLSNTIENEFTL